MALLAKICPICDKAFERPNRKVWRSTVYCSKQCSEEQKRRVRGAKHRCKDCGSDGPFRSYKTNSGRVSRHSRCDKCRKAARRTQRKKQAIRNQERRYTQKFRARMRATGQLHRIPHSKQWATKNPWRYLFRRMLTNVNRSKGAIELKITLDEFIEEIGGSIPETCPIFGIKLDFEAPPKSDCIPTVDRINSSLPYQRGNIAIISWRANIIKNMGTAEEHRRIAAWIDGSLQPPIR